MASFNKDDFVTGSDFSDLSDVSEDDLNVNESLDVSSDSGEDCQFCVCGKPSTREMVACESRQGPGGVKNVK